MPDNVSQDVAIRGEGNIVVGKGNVVVNPIPPAEARLRHDLGILLKNVENTWIKGVLEKSVHEAALLDLGMELREEAVDNPWRMVMERPDQSREALPQGRKIKDIFDEANRLLLILGEPGSGKTTTLLQLARGLIVEMDESFTQPVPAILNLSTWTNKQQPLDEWLIEELNSKYRLPKKDGRKWLTDHRILPLLDGLDEVKVENRAACVESINQLVDDYGLHGLVVCSRIKDYTDLNVRLAFYRAIYLQPFTSEQVDEYLNQAGDKLADLHATLQGDGALQEMAKSPLILNIMSLAYQDTTSKSLSDSSLDTKEERIKHLFDIYIARMFYRKGDLLGFDNEQTKQRLSWLARIMQLHNQEVFLIEDLQPSWLQTPRSRLIYILVSRLLGWLIFAMGIGLIFVGLSFWQPIWMTYDLSNGLIFGLILGLIFGLPASVIDILRFEWLDKWRDRKGVSDFWWSVINIASVWLIFGLLGWLISWLLSDQFYGLIFGLFGGLFFGIRSSRKSLMNDIQTVEALRWYWDKALKGWLISGLISGLILGLLFGPIFGLGGLIFGLIGAVFFGLSREIIETKTTPNQGIRLSARNAVLGGLLVGLASGLIAVVMGVSWELFSGQGLGQQPLGQILLMVSGGLILGRPYRDVLGPIVGLMGALWYGGLDIIQHYTLRLILIIQGHTPRNYIRFLDYVVDRIFLQKVGGGYRFIHRMLLEHFANMQETE